MKTKDIAWELRFWLQRIRPPRSSQGIQTEDGFSMSKQVKLDETSALYYVDFIFSGKGYRFYFSEELKDLAPFALERLFTYRAFAQLRLQNKPVIDIGSFIGDSALFFALRGARSVVALEPSSRFCAIASVNVERNGMGGLIHVVNEGAGKSGFAQVPVDVSKRAEDPRASVHREWRSSGRDGVRINSLGDIAERFDPLADTVLKVNCEGCEYDLILGASRVELRRFPEIMVEYHYGSGALTRKLEESGFSVLVTQNRLELNRSFSDPRLEIGLLYARRLAE